MFYCQAILSLIAVELPNWPKTESNCYCYCLVLRTTLLWCKILIMIHWLFSMSTLEISPKFRFWFRFMKIWPKLTTNVCRMKPFLFNYRLIWQLSSSSTWVRISGHSDETITCAQLVLHHYLHWPTLWCGNPSSTKDDVS